MKPGVYDIWNKETKVYAGRVVININDGLGNTEVFKYAWAHSLEDIPKIESALENGWYIFNDSGSSFRTALELRDGELFDEDGDFSGSMDSDMKAVAKFGKLEEISD